MIRPRHAAWHIFEAFIDDCRVLAQDRDGRILCGTSVGLTLFDGRNFTTFGRKHGLWPDATVTAIALAADGTPWVGTGDGTVAAWDGTRFNVAPGTAVKSTITALLHEPDGSVLVGNQTGLHRISGDRVLLLSELPVTCLLLDRRGYLWVGTREGIHRVRDNGIVPLDPKFGLSDVTVTAIAADPRSNLWVAGTRAIMRFDGSAVATFTSNHGLPRAPITALAVDSRGLLWFGTTIAGAGFLDGDRITTFTTKSGLPHDTVSAIIEDREGSIWLACGRGGIAQYDSTGTTPVVAHPVDEAMARSSICDAWWGRHRTLVRLDGSTCHDCLSFPSQILCILEDRQNRLWVGTRDGLWLFPDAKAPTSPSARQVFAVDGDFTFSPWNLHEDARGTIWMVEQSVGLHRYDETRGAFMRVSEAASFGGCTNLTSTTDGRVWLTGWNWRGAGLFDGRTVRKFSTEHGLPDSCTTSVATMRDGTTWIGTSRGLAMFEGHNFRAFGVDDGMPGRFVQRLTPDSRGQLWIATLGGGVGRYDGRNFQILTTDDGLPSNCVTGILEARDGSMLIGTYRGVCRYVPDYRSVPEIRIDHVEADTVYPPGGHLRIPASASTVRIRFHGVSLKTHRMRYTFTLEGRDTDWSSTWNEEVRYENLEPGSYTFRVIAINRDMVYSRAAAVAAFDVVKDPRDEKLHQLETEVRTLEGMLPICSVCKRIRNDRHEWEQMEIYITHRSNADFSHGYCPDCASRIMEELNSMRGGGDGPLLR